jgi:hypothetical protein
MKESLATSSAEVDLNPHSDLPAGPDISTEISDAPPAAETPARPFGVFTAEERQARRDRDIERSRSIHANRAAKRAAAKKT